MLNEYSYLHGHREERKKKKQREDEVYTIHITAHYIK